MKEMGWAICETKYDGIRVQIHRKGEEIEIYTRRLENISKALPEIVSYIRESLPPRDFIVEGEIIVTRDGKPISFQYILQRVRRKYDIERMVDQIPLTLYLFDTLYYGNNLIDTPFHNRREILESIVQVNPGKVEISRQVNVTPSDIEKAQELFEYSINEGHEGIMIKDPEAPIWPGIGVRKCSSSRPTRNSGPGGSGGTYGR